MKDYTKKLISDSIEMKKQMLEKNVEDIVAVAQMIISAYRKNRKVVVFGNGGSAGDSQHFVTELVCRFEKERKSLNAITLTTNTSAITATGNDYSFDVIFSRQVESAVDEGDVVVGISTSGNASNVIKGVEQAKKQKAMTVGFTGEDGGKLKSKVDKCICVPSKNTARVQEGHILVIHILCKLIEDELFKGN